MTEEESVIPILSWHGSPILQNKFASEKIKKEIKLDKSGDSSDVGDMEEYWSKIETINHVENGDINADITKNGNFQTGKKICFNPEENDDYVAYEKYREIVSGKDRNTEEGRQGKGDDGEEEDDDDDDVYGDDYDNDENDNDDNEEDDGKEAFEKKIIGSYIPNNYFEEYGILQDEEDSDEDEDENENENEDEAIDYDDLYNYIKEGGGHEIGDGSLYKDEEIEDHMDAKDFTSTEEIQNFYREKLNELDKIYEEKESSDVDNEKLSKKKKKRQMKEYILRNEENYNNKTTSNPFAYDINKENSTKKNESFFKGDEAGYKHRKMLVDMVNKRREQEEEAQRLYEIAKLKRKKFKDALLEKALRARAAKEEAREASNPNTTTEGPSLSEAELLQKEESRKALIAMTRRKFKAQYKKVLEKLMEKQKQKQQEPPLKPKKKTSNATSQAQPTSSELPAGSALSAVRGKNIAVESFTGEIQEQEEEEEEEEGENVIDDPTDKIDERDPEELKAKKLASKLQQLKITAYLSALAEHKKVEDNKKINAEQRAKKRAAILAGRVLKEAAERKLMSAEDKYINGVLPEESKPPEKKHKLTAAESEAIFNRLAAGYSKRNDSDETNNKPNKKVIVNNIIKKPAPPPPLNTKPSSVESGVNKTSKSDDPEENSITHPTADYASDRRAPPAARDFSDWKRKNAVPPTGKVFSMTGWYPCVKQALLDRGWYCNPDPQSPYFDLKWSLRSCEVSLDVLQPWQLTNHFHKNGAITTKVGLLRSLQSLVWFADVSPNDIIPRGYDLTNPQETLIFMDDFACQQAENILKTLYFKVTGMSFIESEVLINSSDGPEDDTFSRPKTPKIKLEQPDIEGNLKINSCVLKACFDILEKRIRLKESSDEYLDDGKTDYSDPLVSLLEWEIISSLDPFKTGDLPQSPGGSIESIVRRNLEEEEAIEPSLSNSQKEKIQQELREKNKLRSKKDEIDRINAMKAVKKLSEVDSSLLSRIHSILLRIRRLDKTQFGLGGSGSDCKNMWIVKPAAKSRGRGIMCFNELPKLLKYVSADTGTSTLWIVQKYMENALIVAKRKFDMRQWVLVTDWNPLTIYFYHECYIRFSVEEYTTNDSSIDNLYVHLVNNSIGKNSQNFTKTAESEDGQLIEGYMWSCESFRQHLINRFGQDYMNEKIRPRMKDIAKWSLMSASDMIDHRKNSWELYGFDYMVDSDFNAWLIEINSSPACDYSTKVTESYVQRALVELLSVTLDCREWDNAPRKTRGERPETGGWECIYKGPLLETPVASFGADLSLKGEAIKLPKKTFVSFNTYPFKMQSSSSSVNATQIESKQELTLENKPNKAQSRPNDILNIVKSRDVPTKSFPSKSNSESGIAKNSNNLIVPTKNPNKSSNLIESSMDDSVTFDDSDVEEEKNQTVPNLGNKTTAPKLKVRNNLVAAKPVSNIVTNAKVLQPKLFTLDF